MAERALALLPPRLHRAALPLAHRLRHRWRRWRGDPLEGVSVVLENAAGDVLLLRHSYGPCVWALPGGGMARGEEPEAAARREIAEELGIKLGALTLIGTLEERISGSPHKGHIFAARIVGNVEPDRREVIEAAFFAPDNLPADVGAISARRLALWRAARD